MATEPPTQPSDPTVYIDWHTSKTIDGLDIYVTSLEVKLDTTGHEILQVDLRLRADGKEEQVHFRGPEPQPPLRWNGYEVRVLGGSKESVGITVRRAQ